jgi:hypothetical protein
VPFLSTNPDNVVDQNTYNNTYRLPDGSETQQPNPGGKKKSGARRLVLDLAVGGFCLVAAVLIGL